MQGGVIKTTFDDILVVHYKVLVFWHFAWQALFRWTTTQRQFPMELKEILFLRLAYVNQKAANM